MLIKIKNKQKIIDKIFTYILKVIPHFILSRRSVFQRFPVRSAWGGENIIGRGGGCGGRHVRGGQMVRVRWPWDRDRAGEVRPREAQGRDARSWVGHGEGW